MTLIPKRLLYFEHKGVFYNELTKHSSCDSKQKEWTLFIKQARSGRLRLTRMTLQNIWQMSLNISKLLIMTVIRMACKQ